MKKFYSVIIWIVAALATMAQAPDGFKYQAVLRDGSGEIKTNTDVEIEISILQGSASGSAVYTETHDATTNSHGLITLNIGNGSTADNLGTIDWSNGPYFIKVSVDGTVMGTSQLLSVPYAMYAEKAGDTFSGSYSELDDVPEYIDEDYTDDFSGDYNDLTNKPDLSDTANYLTSETDPLFGASVAGGITDADTTGWNESTRKWRLKENDTLYYDRGLVGIGTDMPFSDLTVEGTGRSHDVTIRDHNAFMAIDGEGTNSGIQFFSDGNYKSTFYYNPSHERLMIYNGAGNGLTLNESNYLGIKTAAPQTELHVNGSVRVDETTGSPDPKTIYGNSLPLAYASVNTNGSILSGYGIESVENPQTGYYTITLSQRWSGHPAVMVTCYNSSPAAEIPTYYAAGGSNVVYVRLANGSGNAITSVFSIVVFGMPYSQ